MTEHINYEDALNSEGIIIHHIKGISMYPLLRQGKDTVIIEKIKNKPKKNDVLFYKRDNGEYVLHRLIKIKNGAYIIRGDNCYNNEYDIADRHILGVMTQFYRDEKLVDCRKSTKYKLYSYLWPNASYYIKKLRIFSNKVLSKIKRIFSK